MATRVKESVLMSAVVPISVVFLCYTSLIFPKESHTVRQRRRGSISSGGTVTVLTRPCLQRTADAHARMGRNNSLINTASDRAGQIRVDLF